MKHLLLSFVLLLSPVVLLASPADLRINDLREPVVFDAFPLRFSWKVGDAKTTQGAYQIEVRRLTPSGPEVVWDSSKVASGDNRRIEYRGPAMGSRERYDWRVRLWDANGGAGEWSAPMTFETGLTQAGDWGEAKWIGCDRDMAKGEQAPAELMGPWMTGPADAKIERFLLNFDLPDKPIVWALGYWGVEKPVGAVSLMANLRTMPAEIRRHAIRMVRGGTGGFYDLSFVLEPGKSNRLELLIDKPRAGVVATVGLRIVFADGEEIIIQSGEDWKVAAEGSGVSPARVVAAYGADAGGVATVLPDSRMAPIRLATDFTVKPGLKNARLYFTGLGWSQPEVNGQRVDDHIWAPAKTDYEAFAFYETRDVASALREGNNRLEFLLDAGWFHEVGGFGGSKSYGRPGLIARLALDYEDGTTQWVDSGPDWKWAESEIIQSSIYQGEWVDYQKLEVTDWRPVQVLAPLSPKLIASDIPPVRVMRTIPPKTIHRVGPKSWLVDFGESMNGWVRFTNKNEAGQRTYLRFSEYAEGPHQWNTPLSHWRFHGVPQNDLIISDGQSREFAPRFNPKSFRNVLITGPDELPDDLVAESVHTDFPVLAKFESSDPMLNRLFENGIRTGSTYMTHTFGDMPRERALWGAENFYTENMAFNLFDWTANNRHMARLWNTGRMAEGGVPGNVGVGLRLTTLANDFTWSISPVFLSRAMLRYEGDTEIVRAYYDKMRHYLRYYESKAERDGTIPHIRKHGDISPPSGVELIPSNKDLVAAMTFFHAQRSFAEMADALGETEDAAHARAQADKIRETVLSFYDKDSSRFGNGVEMSLALAFGVFENDPEEEKRLAASLAKHYRDRQHVWDGGFLGHEIYPQLARHGYVEDALKVMTNPEGAGPARTIKLYDATTYHEAYHMDKYEQMRQGLNFIVHSHPAAWLITDLAGIRPDLPTPHDRKLIFAPAIPASGEPTRVAAELETAQGQAASAWQRADDGKVSWTFTVPANSEARVQLPDGAKEIVLDGEPEAKSGLAGRVFLPGTYFMHFTLHSPK